MSFLPYVPPGQGIRAVYSHDPHVWDPFLEFTHNLMRGPSPLSFRERELIAAYVSALNGCDYCFGAHSAAAEAFGVSPELMQALIEDVESAPVDEKLRGLIRFVRKMTVSPTRMTQEDADRFREAGWSDVAINHAIAIAARYTMVNRMSQAHGIAVDAEELKAAGKRMAESDWNALPEARRGSRG